MSRKFEVEIERISTRKRTITIEAESEGEAEDIAYEKAGNIDFSDGVETSADYEVTRIKEAGSF